MTSVPRLTDEEIEVIRAALDLFIDKVKPRRRAVMAEEHPMDRRQRNVAEDLWTRLGGLHGG